MHLLHSIHIKKKRTKNTTMNTRQTDNDHPRQYLIRKDKINPNTHRSRWPMRDRAPTGDDITRHQNTNTQKEQHARKTEHLTQEHGPTQINEMNHTTRRTMTLHIQKETKAYPRPNVHTHDTQDKYLPIFHTVSSQLFTSLTLTEDLLDSHRYQPGYLTTGKYPHLSHLSIMAV